MRDRDMGLRPMLASLEVQGCLIRRSSKHGPEARVTGTRHSLDDFDARDLPHQKTDR
jgi:hypothetical protein